MIPYKKVLRGSTFFFALFSHFSSILKIVLPALNPRRITNSITYLPFTKERDQKLKYIKFAEKAGLSLHDHSNFITTTGLTEGSSLREITQFQDRTGTAHTRFQLQYKNIPVEGAIIVMHSRGEKILSANGAFTRIQLAETQAKLSESHAEKLAYNHIDAVSYYTTGQGVGIEEPQLVILPLEGNFHLAYRCDIFARDPFSRNYVWVDAVSGKVLKTVDRIHHDHHEGMAETKYEGIQTIGTDSDGQVYTLSDDSRGAQIITLDMNRGYDYQSAESFEDPDNYWSEKANQDDAATNAHYAVQKTFDFYKTRFNRHSFDDQGADILSYIHFGSNYENAFWNGNSFTYGDGDGVHTTALTPLDVVAHEYTHAITQHSAGLVYAHESGALNESFSDIFAVAVDFYVNPSAANYILGEKFSMEGTPVRDMSDPKRFGHPDTYQGENWASSNADNGGVHTNNGVQNYWFWLLSEGGSGTNDLGDPYNVTGIGIEKASEIAYRNLTVYLTPYSDYEEARFYSIQSAIDLYGSCSDEVIAVTNAWYAVGVGAPFSDDVIAGFRSSANFACHVPAAIQFTNTSLNAMEYSWDFGDGSGSQEVHPTHTYTHPGTFSVRLIAEGNSVCSGTDTILLEEFIRIDTSSIPSADACIPQAEMADDAGIAEFRLNEIYDVSGSSAEEGNYVDKSCIFSTDLTAGEWVEVEVRTGSGTAENVALWIDLNNDGNFESAERLWESQNKLKIHTGSFIIPVPQVFDNPLRMRVISDHYEYPVMDACGTLHSGQAEDYRVIIHENYRAPVADFMPSDSVLGTDEKVLLLDRSLNIPMQWNWTLGGGNPSESDAQTPEVSYQETGQYSISLRVSNNHGSDSLTKAGIIRVLPASIMGEDGNSTLGEGLLFDSGDSDQDYGLNETSTFVIEPPCAQSIQLRFLSFSLENGSDYIRIYDGRDEQGVLLLEATGTDIPDEITASSGSAYIIFMSDHAGTDRGFKLHWTADQPPEESIEADFMLSDTIVAFRDRIHFTDISTNQPLEWVWEFGDGSTSTLQNPEHCFTSPGTKEIVLYASNCFSSDTEVRQVYVLPSPQIEVMQESYSEILEPDATASYPLNIANHHEEGILNYSLMVRENSQEVKISRTEVFSSKEAIDKDMDTVSFITPDKNSLVPFTQTNKSDPAFGYDQPGLEEVLSNFTASSADLTSLIPDVYYFEEGSEGERILDGGNDMYDGGNYISTNFAFQLDYSNNLIQGSTAFGADGRYFSSKQPGIFLLAADMDKVEEFSLAGNLGADGLGSVDASIIRIEKGMQTYTGFVKRVFGTSDPSVNHLIIVPDAHDKVSHSIDINSNSDAHVIHNLADARRLYYLLISSGNGGYIADSLMVDIMEAFISIAEPSCSWIKAETSVIQADPGAESSNNLQINTAGLSPGNYSADIHILSNDEDNCDIIVPFDLLVSELCQAEFALHEYIGTTVAGNMLTDTSWIINQGPGTLIMDDPDLQGDHFLLNMEKHHIEAGDSASLILYYLPEEAGEDTAVLTLHSNAKNMAQIIHMFRASALPAPAPGIVNYPDDRIMYLGGEQHEILLDTIFSESSGTGLHYDIDISDAGVISWTLEDGLLTLIPHTAGSSSVHITATNIWGSGITTFFNVTVQEADRLGSLTEETRLNVFPNPTNGSLTISGMDPEIEIMYVSLTDLSGKTFHRIDFPGAMIQGSYSLDVSFVPAGLYILKIASGTTIRTTRIVKQ